MGSIVYGVVIAAAIAVMMRFILFDENYELSIFKNKGKKKKVKEKKKKATLEEYIKDSGSNLTVKKLKTISIFVGLGFAIYGWVGTGWIVGAIPAYFIGTYFAVMPIKLAARIKNNAWDDQIMMFLSNMIQEIPLNNGSMTVSVRNSIKILGNPLKGKLVMILADSGLTSVSISDGFRRLHRTTGRSVFQLIAEAMDTVTVIGISACTQSFEHIYDIAKQERSTRVERTKQLGQYALFVKLLTYVALASPLVMRLFFASAYEDASSLLSKIFLTVGFVLILVIFKVTEKLESSDDLK